MGFDGFPVIYRGESVYGICSRFTKRSQPVSNARWLKELFGNAQLAISIDLPTHLTHFSTQIPPIYGYSDDYLIEHHTAAPYYWFGRESYVIASIHGAMKTNGAKKLQAFASLSNSQVDCPAYLRICEKCFREDRQLNTRGHWYVDHQLPGIDVCPRHGIYLISTHVPRNRLTAFITIETALNTGTFDSGHKMPDRRLIELAQDAAYLLDHPQANVTLETLHRQYYVACAREGLILRSGALDIRGAIEKIGEYYPPELLKELNMPLGKITKKTWAYQLLTAPKEARPTIKHLLVIRSLGYVLDEFLKLRLSPESDL